MREPPLLPRPVTSLSEASRQFARWRATRPVGARIPPALWRSAVELARSDGVSKTSQALHLDYYAVQRRLAEAAVQGPETTGQQFVELALWSGVKSSQHCRLELRDRDGGTVCLDLSGWSALDLASFVRTVVGRRES